MRKDKNSKITKDRSSGSTNDSILISKSKLKKLENAKKELEISHNFEERHEKTSPAVLLRHLKQENTSNSRLQHQYSMTKKERVMQNKRNDGLSAMHKPIREMVNGNGYNSTDSNRGRKRKSEKALMNESESSETKETVQGQHSISNSSANTDDSNYNEFESMVPKKESPPAKKSKRIISESSESNGGHGDWEISDNALFDEDEEDQEFGDEDEMEDEELGDDLRDENLIAKDESDLEDEEMDSFIASDGSIEDEADGLDELSESDEEGSFHVDITGYEVKRESENCVILQSKHDYTMAYAPFKLFKFSSDTKDSVQVGLKALQWILSPLDTQTFFSHIFQKRCLVLKRRVGKYFDGFFTKRDFIAMLQNNDLEYGKDVNVALYEGGKRETLNKPEGNRASAADVWSHLSKGRSAQLVSPQVHNDNIWYLCEILQEVFCSFVGANCYMTPAESAGFAPHWDDIDAFMLQTEGKKYWKIYAPQESSDVLPLESSANFTDTDLVGRDPVFEGWLEQGDALYVPRGWIHQASTGKEQHSLHVTVSICRNFSFSDYFKKASAIMVETLTQTTKHLRRSLPPLLLDMGGVAKREYSGEETLTTKVLPITDIFARMFGNEFSLNVANYIDLMGQEFFKTALPPMLTPEERELICSGSLFDGAAATIKPETEVKLVRKHAQRLLFENEDSAFLIHRMNNSRRYEGFLETIIDFPAKFEDGLATLMNSYPMWTKVSDLGLDKQDANIALATLLFENGLLLKKGKNASTTEKGAMNADAAKKKHQNMEVSGKETQAKIGKESGQESGEKKKKKRKNRNKRRKNQE